MKASAVLAIVCCYCLLEGSRASPVQPHLLRAKRSGGGEGGDEHKDGPTCPGDKRAQDGFRVLRDLLIEGYFDPTANHTQGDGHFCTNNCDFYGRKIPVFRCPVKGFDGGETYCCGEKDAEYCCGYFEHVGRLGGAVVGFVLAIIVAAALVILFFNCLKKCSFYKGMLRALEVNGNIINTIKKRLSRDHGVKPAPDPRQPPPEPQQPPPQQTEQSRH